MASKSALRAKHLVQQDRELRFELVRLRESSGLSQADVARALGISRQAVAKFERVDADPRLSTIRRYAHAIEAIVSHKVEPDQGQLEDGMEWRAYTYATPATQSVPAPRSAPNLVSADSMRLDFGLAA